MRRLASPTRTEVHPAVRILDGQSQIPQVSNCIFESHQLNLSTLRVGQQVSYSSDTFSTARNASWGISTRPTRFMRFFPSFCFSSSLRFREMSPP